MEESVARAQHDAVGTDPAGVEVPHARRLTPAAGRVRYKVAAKWK